MEQLFALLKVMGDQGCTSYTKVAGAPFYLPHAPRKSTLDSDGDIAAAAERAADPQGIYVPGDLEVTIVFAQGADALMHNATHTCVDAGACLFLFLCRVPWHTSPLASFPSLRSLIHSFSSIHSPRFPLPISPSCAVHDLDASSKATKGGVIKVRTKENGWRILGVLTMSSDCKA